MAKKNVSVFFCQECGNETSKWSGQCPACGAWNTLVEEVVDKSTIKTRAKVSDVKPTKIIDVTASNENRISTNIEEFDRVLGGGIVPGSMVLVGGDPGIGKSTLLLQTCRELCLAGVDVMYVSGEESLQQIKIRADRIGKFNDKLDLLCETNLDTIKAVVEREKPTVLIIDSIQTMYNESVTSAPGSVSQVRESTSVLMEIAKVQGIAVFIVGHVTKEGTVAGPRVLEHMVDTVLYFEGDRHASYRILRGVKNRFGSTNEIGVFEMRDVGLMEVKNPSAVMLDGRPENATGSIVTCSMEGTRPILVEIQSLVSKTAFEIPRRMATGCDYNRVNLLVAVLERMRDAKANRSCGIFLGRSDIYVNIAGGIRINEPAVDLAIAMAIYSSEKEIAVDAKTIIFGEIGLSGEVRSVSMAEQRVSEAKKLGFEKAIIPYSNMASVSNIKGIEVVGVANVKEAVDAISR
ncbi:DNA repair protein RadA [Pseudobutyrivibrio sp.]|uniref:DNA repair protein RadA n=1 Tax=Pseudobutyrivibrio sp. TaxID=2014367 RepID=UPI001B546988|nr:DNA repair protein RadA [Pseudobutyrivibrio sp.]MBP5598591.1 DNA repair protein RadA [Pseudobutyrivibrio sp.]MBQ7469026.1 DNA repair protein RadA [Pseudobutyrivibrio sp.]MBR5648762.1 DNA repair protein RadA [Pseudobutyrivibrio sp.]